MASLKQGDGCGTLLFLVIVWWLGSKYWEYVSVEFVAMLMPLFVDRMEFDEPIARTQMVTNQRLMCSSSRRRAIG